MSRGKRPKSATAVITISTGDASGLHSLPPVAEVMAVRIAVPELPWLHRVVIRPNPGDSTVEVEIVPENEEQSNCPRLIVRSDMTFTLRS